MVNPLDVLTLDPAPAAAAPTVAAGAKQVLHVGCGARSSGVLHPRFAGWTVVRLDNDPSVAPDILASLTQMTVVASDSMDAVYSYRVLQRLYAHEVPLALAEFRRVLKPDGLLLLSTIDLRKLAELIVADKFEESAYSSPAGPIFPIDLMFGHRSSIAQGRITSANRTGFTARLLGEMIARTGFSDVRIQPSGFDLWGSASKGATPAASFTLLDPPAPKA